MSKLAASIFPASTDAKMTRVLIQRRVYQGNKQNAASSPPNTYATPSFLKQSRLRSQPTPTVQLSLSLDLCLAVVRGKGWRHRSDPSQGLAR
ncbi:hypothetical protein PC120_g13001 [Phytophthora cactorum]|nr:hypothetical protein PC120_g13001 [Phytophthora cactorum]